MLSRFDLRGLDADPRAVLAEAMAPVNEPVDAVRRIIERVRAEGDDAVRAFTLEFDGCAIEDLRVPASELTAALDGLDPELRTALEQSAARIRGYHEAQAAAQGPVAYEQDGVSVEELLRPVDRVGLYVPGGRAAYPSTVLMTAIPASVAGVPETVLCVPPDRHGKVPSVTLAAAALAGVDAVFRVGGAQAVAAMAYGTESIPKVDLIVGPGNIFVSIAKREVAGAGVVGIESPAGPSVLVVVADGHAPPALVAADLAAQAEHGPNGKAILVTWDEAVADAVERALDGIVADSATDELGVTLESVGRTVLVRDADQAIDVANLLAPEHLQIVTDDADARIGAVRNAGAVFVGPYAPTALGDYAAGANHVLPTGGAARFASALRVDDFRKHLHVVRATPEGSAALSRQAAVVARAEGLDEHARSLDLRAQL
jgi:histidinol dehydrogenase